LAAIEWQTALSAKNVGEAHFLSSTIQAQKVAIYYAEVGIIIRQSTTVSNGNPVQIDFNRITAFVPETGTPLQIQVIGVIHGALPGCFKIDFAEVEGAPPLSHGECTPGVALDNFVWIMGRR
jgi:hypothetical protein